MKILTEKEEPMIHSDEFEVKTDGKIIISGRLFDYMNSKYRKLSISLCFDNNITQKDLVKAMKMIHTKFITRGKEE